MADALETHNLAIKTPIVGDSRAAGQQDRAAPLDELNISSQPPEGYAASMYSQLDGLLTEGAIDEFCAVLIVTALSRKRTPRQNEAINLYLESCTNVPDVFAQISARKELAIEDPNRREFAALGELLFVLAAADFDPTLLSRIEYHKTQHEKKDDSPLQQELATFAQRKLLETLSPIARLCTRQVRHVNSDNEQAIIEGALRTIFENISDTPEGILQRFGSLISRHRASTTTSERGIFDQELNQQQKLLLGRLIKIAKQGEPERDRIWKAHLESQAIEQEREEQRLAREEREKELVDPEKISARLNFILSNFSSEMRLRELESLLYMDISITQRQFHDIIDSLPRGLNFGSGRGFKAMRDEMKERHLGDFETPRFEPVDRYIAWLALHRLSKVDDPQELMRSQSKLFHILERGCDWSTLDPEYQVALKYLFNQLLSDLQSGDTTALPQINN